MHSEAELAMLSHAESIRALEARMKTLEQIIDALKRAVESPRCRQEGVKKATNSEGWYDFTC